MRAVATCSKCKRVINTDCQGCIDAGSSLHMCSGKEKVVNMKWKKYAEDERELLELENGR